MNTGTAILFIGGAALLAHGATLSVGFPRLIINVLGGMLLGVAITSWFMG